VDNESIVVPILVILSFMAIGLWLLLTPQSYLKFLKLIENINKRISIWYYLSEMDEVDINSGHFSTRIIGGIFFFFAVIMLISLTVFSRNDNKIQSCGEEKLSEISPVKIVPPQYPIHTQNVIKGWVKMEFKVDPDGKITHVKILDAEPKHIFERSAKKSLLKSEFSKSSKELRCGIITMHFELED